MNFPKPPRIAIERPSEVLLKVGAKANAKDKKGRTALALAREKGHRKAIAFLEKAGAQR